MKIIGKDQDITISDDVRFILETKNAEDCLAIPYQITNATIYFITRDFADATASAYQKEYSQDNLVKEYENVKKELCAKFKQNVVAATTTNISLFGEQNIDGIDVQENERVLVKNQENKEENGIYIVKQTSWERSEDANSKNNISKGMYLFVENGIENINTGWVLEAPKNIQIGTTPLNFLRFSSIDQPKESPDENSKLKLENLKKQIEESKKRTTFYYKDSIVIKTFGGSVDPDTGELYPAWLNPNLVPIDVVEKVSNENLLVPYEENGEIVEGKFTLDWQPLDCREGDYFICWSWMPNLAGDVFSNHIFFSLEGDGRLTTSIPTHQTSTKKYEILMDRYLPEMFKTIISDSDLTPRVLKGFNNAVAKGFTFIENQANQMIDLLDANATHEQLLPLLSNFFNLKLKSNDPTLWRRQIKKAIPNFKRKGSIEALKSAFSDAGIRFISLKKMWQVVSKYTYQEHFEFSDSNIFRLSKNIITPLDSNFKVWIRRQGEDWIDLSSDEENWFDSVVEISEETNELVWKGELSQGDSVRVLYKFRNIPESERSLEEYIRLLPLMDNRDERDQKYPIKNWNTRLIEEDDDLFEIIIPVRHPLSDPIIWGRVRTEFPYSENAYNMEEYNGSKRDSYDPCDIDKDFIDPCSQCQSSKFVIDLEIEKLSDDSYEEINKILEEFMPFHAVAHSFNLAGSINEFIKPSEEKIEALITLSQEDVLLAGEGQHIFNRSVDRTEISNVKREVLSNFSIAQNGASSVWTGVLKNQSVILCPSSLNTDDDLNNSDFRNKSQFFGAKNIDTSFLAEDAFESSNLLEILGQNKKNYSLSNFSYSNAELFSDVDQQIIGPLFEYRISNKIADLSVGITQVNKAIFNDEDSDFGILGIVSQYDIGKELSNSEIWKFKISNKIYEINNVLPDGSLLLGDYTESSPIEGWQIINEESVIKESNSGSLTELNYGLIEIDEENAKKIRIGDYVYIDWQEDCKIYKIKSFKNGFLNKFYIENYDQGSAGSENIKIYRRIIENKVGRLAYQGILFEADSNIEDVLSISNGENQDIENINSSNIKENYVLVKDQKYYSIININENNLVLDGPLDDWTLQGQQVEFSIYKFEKMPLNLKERKIPAVAEFNFDYIDRSGKGLVSTNQNNQVYSALAVLNSASQNEKIEIINQNESIEFDIEYKEEE